MAASVWVNNSFDLFFSLFKSLGVKKAIIVGGEAAVSAKVKTALDEAIK